MYISISWLLPCQYITLTYFQLWEKLNIINTIYNFKIFVYFCNNWRLLTLFALAIQIGYIVVWTYFIICFYNIKALNIRNSQSSSILDTLNISYLIKWIIKGGLSKSKILILPLETLSYWTTEKKLQNTYINSSLNSYLQFGHFKW